MVFEIIKPPDDVSVTFAVRLLFESSKPNGAVTVLLADHVKFLKITNRVLLRTEFYLVTMHL